MGAIKLEGVKGMGEEEEEEQQNISGSLSCILCSLSPIVPLVLLSRSLGRERVGKNDMPGGGGGRKGEKVRWD